MILNRTKTKLAISLLIMFTSVGVFSYTLAKVLKKSSLLESQVELIAANSAKAQEYNDLKNLLERTKNDRTQLYSFILHEDDIISFISQLEEDSRRLEVGKKITSLNVKKEEGGADMLDVEMTFEGTSLRAKELLLLLETLPYVSELTSYSYRVDNTNASLDNTVSGNIRLLVTIQKYE